MGLLAKIIVCSLTCAGAPVPILLDNKIHFNLRKVILFNGVCPHTPLIYFRSVRMPTDREILEPYQRDKKYDSIFLFRKKA
jgi:hypothetical protein